MLHSEGLKNSLDIESKLFLALSVFCSGAVPLYSSHSQNTKFISLSQSLPACRNLKLDFFLHAGANTVRLFFGNVKRGKNETRKNRNF